MLRLPVTRSWTRLVYGSTYALRTRRFALAFAFCFYNDCLFGQVPFLCHLHTRSGTRTRYLPTRFPTHATLHPDSTPTHTRTLHTTAAALPHLPCPTPRLPAAAPSLRTRHARVPGWFTPTTRYHTDCRAHLRTATACHLPLPDLHLRYFFTRAVAVRLRITGYHLGSVTAFAHCISCPGTVATRAA